MINARHSHGNAYGVFISPEGTRTITGGNTPGNDRITLRPEGRQNTSNSCALTSSRLKSSVTSRYFPAKPLIENHNVVPSFSPGLAVQRPTPGKLSHKIQPLISREGGPREARIRTAANSPKIQHCFPHPQTNPHPKSTLAHPKSTVELGHEPLIRVENGLRSPLSPTSYRPKSGPKIRESNQNQTATNRKKISLLLSARSLFHPSSSIFVWLPYASLCQPLPAYPHPCFFRGGSSLYGPYAVARSRPVTASRGQFAPGRRVLRKKIVYFL